MKRIVLAISVVILTAAALMAHQGHAHQMLGTVERSRACHFVMKMQSGESKTIFLAPSSRFEQGGKAATLQDLAAGSRVSVTVEDDDETAVTVKVGGAK